MTKLRQLLLLRHAKSSWDDPDLDDFDRPLNGRGKRAATIMGLFLAGRSLRPDLVICSPARRTRQTLSRLGQVMDGVPVRFEPAVYEAGCSDLLTILRQCDDRLFRVLLIGHNPGLESVAGYLSDGQGDRLALDRLDVKFPTCALADLTVNSPEWAALDRGGARLDGLIRPADLDAGPKDGGPGKS